MNSGPQRQDLERRADFDRVARLYRWAEYLLLGPLLTRTRLHFLHEIEQTRHALVLGDGDGRFLAQLLRRAPSMHALAVDTSATMLGLLRNRCAFAGSRLTTFKGSATALPIAGELRGVDLIATHFFLDCLSQAQVDHLTCRLANEVAPGCLWVISEFGIPQQQPWRALGQGYVRLLYLAFGILTRLPVQVLPNIDSALHRAGFHRIHHAERLKGLLYSQIWQLRS